MGCPDRSIEKQGCGSAMIKTPAVAAAIVAAAKRGAKSDEAGGIPVSVKTRLGYNQDEVETWISAILATNPATLTVHARTRKEMSKVPARWERIARVVEIRDALGINTRILGNGDVLSLEDAHTKINESGADGVMIGRALFGNPWFFHPTKRLPIRLTALPTSGVDREAIITHDTTRESFTYVTLEERLLTLVEHSHLFAELLPHKNFSVMKKHYKAYVNGFHGAAELRTSLMVQSDAKAVEAVVHAFLARNT
jgi:tRNA-dihydrouridine synthase